MRIFSSAENCRRVARRISLTTCSAGSFTGPDFCPIFAPSMATMGQKSSLLRKGQQPSGVSLQWQIIYRWISTYRVIGRFPGKSFEFFFYLRYLQLKAARAHLFHEPKTEELVERTRVVGRIQSRGFQSLTAHAHSCLASQLCMAADVLGVGKPWMKLKPLGDGYLRLLNAAGHTGQPGEEGEDVIWRLLVSP
jgi:hypothetical protein